MGWVSKDLINYVGQHQVFSTDSIDSLIFYQGYYFGEKESLNRKEIGSSIIFNTEKNTAFNVRSEDTVDVMVPTSVWDHSKNTLTNVEGDELYISKIEEIERQSKNINFHFIFDSSFSEYGYFMQKMKNTQTTALPSVPAHTERTNSFSTNERRLSLNGSNTLIKSF